jgi:hypothetical protein
VCEWKGDTGTGLVCLVFSVAVCINDTALLDAATLSVGITARMHIQAENGRFRHLCRKNCTLYELDDEDGFFFFFIRPYNFNSLNVLAV